jgi:hypothetical protein
VICRGAARMVQVTEDAIANAMRVYLTIHTRSRKARVRPHWLRYWKNGIVCQKRKSR